jgi:hypothetical protein
MLDAGDNRPTRTGPKKLLWSQDQTAILSSALSEHEGETGVTLPAREVDAGPAEVSVDLSPVATKAH